MSQQTEDHRNFGYPNRRQIRRRAWMVLPLIVATHLALDLVYRPWVQQSGWNDWGFSSSFTQITAILGIACVMVISEFRASKTDPPPITFFIVVPVIAMAAYEVAQLWLPATFDVQDLLYCLLGGVLNWAMLKLIVFKGA